MKLPKWALDALDIYRPQPTSLAAVANQSSLAAWQALSKRIADHWLALDADKWNIPPHADRDLASQRILECAIACAWDYQNGHRPDDVTQALATLETLNSEISNAAAHLAEMLRHREDLLERYQVDDWGADTPDPIDLWDALEISAKQDWAVCRAVRAARNGQHNAPTLPDLLDGVAGRDNRKPWPNRMPDFVNELSRKKTGWAPLARRLFAMLDDPNQYPSVVLLNCLNSSQLAAILCASYGVNEAAFSEDMVKQLRLRYRQARTIHAL